MPSADWRTGCSRSETMGKKLAAVSRKESFDGKIIARSVLLARSRSVMEENV